MVAQHLKTHSLNMIHFHIDNPLYKAFCALRAPLVRIVKPKRNYYIAPKKSLIPISKKFGFDRGLPIDRYYIEDFIKNNAEHITGDCLEIHDDAYIRRYGNGLVTKADVLDIDTNNTLASIYGDLQNIPTIPDNSYDCIIITQTFGLLPDVHAAVRECWRILKPGGSLLATFSTFGPMREQEPGYWHFTPLSVKKMFGNIFQKQQITISSYGNVLSMQSFIVGLAANELTKKELNYNDPWYALVVGLHAVKLK